jgi:hypothetical protein
MRSKRCDGRLSRKALSVLSHVLALGPEARFQCSQQLLLSLLGAPHAKQKGRWAPLQESTERAEPRARTRP